MVAVAVLMAVLVVLRGDALFPQEEELQAPAAETPGDVRTRHRRRRNPHRKQHKPTGLMVPQELETPGQQGPVEAVALKCGSVLFWPCGCYF